MPFYNLHIDSRNRLAPSSLSAPSFALSNSVSGVKEVRVKNVQFAHTIYNIASNNNVLSTSVGNVILAPQFYTAAAFTTALNAAFVTAFGPGTYVVFVAATNTLNWTLGWPTVSGVSSMSNVLGLSNASTAHTGTFTTTLFLASPLNVSFACPQLQSRRNLYTTNSSRSEPFITVPVNVGFLSVLYYEPWRGRVIDFDQGFALSTLDFTLFDTASGRVLDEISHWAMELELVV